MVNYSCFRMATFRPAKRKYATFHALRFRLLFVVSLPGGAKGRHAKTRHHHHLAGFRLATFRVFAPKTRLYDIAQNSYHNGEIVFDVKNLLFKPQLVIFWKSLGRSVGQSLLWAVFGRRKLCLYEILWQHGLIKRLTLMRTSEFS